MTQDFHSELVSTGTKIPITYSTWSHPVDRDLMLEPVRDVLLLMSSLWLSHSSLRVSGIVDFQIKLVPQLLPGKRLIQPFHDHVNNQPLNSRAVREGMVELLSRASYVWSSA